MAERRWTTLEQLRDSDSGPTELDLGGDKWWWSEEGRATLAQLRDNDPGLTELNLDDKGVGPQGALALAEALKTNTALVKLNLSCNHGMGNGGAAALGAALQSNSTLRELYLRGNDLDDAGAAPVFAHGAHLRALTLEGNRLATVPASVRGMARLEELVLFNNRLVSVHAAGLVALEGTLQYLDLSRNGDTLLQPPAPFARAYDGADALAEIFHYSRDLLWSRRCTLLMCLLRLDCAPPVDASSGVLLRVAALPEELWKGAYIFKFL
jgi:hypothetical protein